MFSSWRNHKKQVSNSCARALKRLLQRGLLVLPLNLGLDWLEIRNKLKYVSATCRRDSLP